MNKIRAIILAGLLVLAAGPKPAYAGLSDILKGAGNDIIENAKITLLDKAEIGWGWNLKNQTSGGAPMALLDVWEYRFLNLNTGWHDPFGKSEGRRGTPSILFGVHADKLARTIAPNSADLIKRLMPEPIRPVWEKITFSYGPGYDLDQGEWTHFAAVNFLFGGE